MDLDTTLPLPTGAEEVPTSPVHKVRSYVLSQNSATLRTMGEEIADLQSSPTENQVCPNCLRPLPQVAQTTLGITVMLPDTLVKEFLQVHPEIFHTLKDPQEVSDLLNVETYEEMPIQGGILRTKLKRCAMRGMTAADAARLVGCAQATVSRIYRDPEFRRDVFNTLNIAFAEVDESIKQTQLSVQEKQQMSVDVSWNYLMGVLQEPDDDNSRASVTLKAKIAESFLDRSWETAKKSSTSDVSIHLSADLLAKAAGTAREMDTNRLSKIRTLQPIR